jgi:Right handed beta helix region
MMWIYIKGKGIFAFSRKEKKMSDKKHNNFKLMSIGLVLTVILLLGNGLSQMAYADDLFVKTDGSGTACTQGEPCTLLAALGQVADSDTVYMAEGTYTGTGAAVMMVTNSISVYGGWDGEATGPVVLNPETYITTVDGEETRRCAQVTAPVTVIFNGFTMTNGRHNEKGGGLYTQNAQVTLDNLIFYHNAAVDLVTEYCYGGGAMIEGGLLFVDGCTFRGNYASSSVFPQGGGLAIYETLTATLEDCLFEDNDSWSTGGLYFSGPTTGFTPLTIRRCDFKDNGWGNSGYGQSAYYSACMILNATANVEDSTFIHNRSTADYGAISVSNSELAFARNIVSGNTSGRTSGLYLTVVSNLTMTNNVFVDNESTYSWVQYPCVCIHNSDGQLLHNTFGRNSGDYGIQLVGGSDITFTNTILAGHTIGILVESGCTATMEATLWGTGSWANDTDWDGTGTINTGTINIWDNPGFVDPDNSDYHISRKSAAIDTGVDAGVTTDIDNDTRPLTDGYDIGADEYNYWTTSGDELALDFGPAGLWDYDGTNWALISGSSPEDMAGWSGGLAIDFGASGLWNYDGSTWAPISGSNVEDMADWANGLAVDFGASGVWNYDGSWASITGSNPDDMAGWSGGLALDFGASGVWSYDGTAWSPISGSSPEAMVGWSEGLAMDFGASGLWSYDGSTWALISSSNVEDMADWANGLSIDFGASGVWNYDGSSWSFTSGSNPQGMLGWSGGLAMDFGASGLWNYDGTTWGFISSSNVEDMDDVDLF